MLITKRSLLTGVIHSIDLPVTQEQIAAWENSSLVIQQAFPQLDADQREFLLSGSTPEEWEAAFPNDE